MVKYGLVSIGVLVEPERCRDNNKEEKNLFLSLEYRGEDMADLVITVSDHDDGGTTNNNDDEYFNNDKIGSEQQQHKPIEKYGTLERILDPEDYSDGVLVNSSRNTIRNRPSCRKSRSESKIQLYNHGNTRAYTSGLKNLSTSAYKSCDYYRQKLYDEGLHPGTSDWLNYSHIQKTAGQKVVNKLVQQQKALETEAEQQRKKSLLSSSSSDSENRNLSGGSPQLSYHNLIPLKKKTVRLDPIPFHTVKISE